MSELTTRGRISYIFPEQSGTSQAGKEWVSQVFTIDTGSQYNNIVAFKIVGREKVDNFANYNKIGQDVDVSFNIQCREYQGRYYTDLVAWMIKDVQTEQHSETSQPLAHEPETQIGNYHQPVTSRLNDDLPF